jgi:GTP-binding protein
MSKGSGGLRRLKGATSRRLKRKGVRGALVAAVHHPADLPELHPVVAFVGRSNVGKSSLLNRLLGVAAARISKNPGRTRGIYFYETDEGHYLADLPGAGYARVSAAERESWKTLAEAFFRSGCVELAVQLIDPRAPEADADVAMRDFLAAHSVTSIGVATKWDRLSASERARASARLEARYGTVVPVSVRSGEGIETLRRLIRQRIERDDSYG